MSQKSFIECFAGTGAGTHAHVRRNYQPKALVEWIPFRQKVLAQRFPDAAIHGDIHTFDPKPYIGVDMVAGGIPCRGVSVTGDQQGLDHPETKRWFAMLDIIKVIKPREVELENVDNMARGKQRTTTMKRILADLEAIGYGGYWMLLSSSQVGLKHQRGRWWLRATRDHKGFKEAPSKPYKESFGLYNVTPDVAEYAPVRDGAPPFKLWPTPRCGGMGTREFVRKDGKIRDDLETTAYMLAAYKDHNGGEFEVVTSTKHAQSVSADFVKYVRSADRQQIDRATAGMRLNPVFVEALHGLKLGWTNPNISNADMRDNEELAHGIVSFCEPFHIPGYENAIQPLSEAATDMPGKRLRNSRILALGDMQSPDAAYAAFNILANRTDAF